MTGRQRFCRPRRAASRLGGRTEFFFGRALPADSQTLRWAELACHFAQGRVYAGKSSPWWYDAAQFHELLYASGDRPVRDLIASLDGCTGGTAGAVVATAKLNRTVCHKVSRTQATILLEAARIHAKPVTLERLRAGNAAP